MLESEGGAELLHAPGVALPQTCLLRFLDACVDRDREHRHSFRSTREKARRKKGNLQNFPTSRCCSFMAALSHGSFVLRLSTSCQSALKAFACSALLRRDKWASCLHDAMEHAGISALAYSIHFPRISVLGLFVLSCSILGGQTRSLHNSQVYEEFQIRIDRGIWLVPLTRIFVKVVPGPRGISKEPVLLFQNIHSIARHSRASPSIAKSLQKCKDWQGQSRMTQDARRRAEFQRSLSAMSRHADS